jgi:hypothetical protein
MSVVIDNTDGLMKLLKQLNLKVSSVEELRQLLETINLNYNPDASRMRAAKLIGISVPCVLAGCTAGVSCTLVPPYQHLTPHHVDALALIWGVSGLVSVVALIVSCILVGGRRVSRTAPESNPAGQESSDPLVTAITDHLR